MKKKISVLIPVYNNQETINSIYLRIKKTIFKIKQNYEIIFIDDGSKDESYKKIKNICLIDKNVICIKLTKNFGQRFALMAGLKHSSGDFIINLDADLQDPPEIISKISKLLYKNEIVIAARNTSSESFIRKFSSLLQHRILNHLIKNYPKKGFTVFGITKRLAKKIIQRGNSISLLQLEILNYGYPHKLINYDRERRKLGKSQFNFSARLNLAIEMITLTTFSLLRFCLFLGVGLLVASLIYIIFVLISYYNNSSPFPGYSPIIIVNLFLGGLNIFVLGVISEYLSVILKEIKLYDKYRIKSFLNKKK